MLFLSILPGIICFPKVCEMLPSYDTEALENNLHYVGSSHVVLLSEGLSTMLEAVMLYCFRRGCPLCWKQSCCIAFGGVVVVSLLCLLNLPLASA